MYLKYLKIKKFRLTVNSFETEEKSYLKKEKKLFNIKP